MTEGEVFIDWRFGNVCDWNCSYCPAAFKQGTAPFFEEDEVKDACARLIEHYETIGKRTVFSFVGGEPTIHPGFLGIMRSLHNRGAGAVVHTNGGSRNLQWWQEIRQYVHAINLSIHLEYATDKQLDDHYIPLIKLFKDSEKSYFQIPYLPQHDAKATAFQAHIKEATGLDVPKRVLYRDSPRNTRLYDYGDCQELKQKAVAENITNNERFVYKDWTCYAGVDQLVIDPVGNIYRGWCRIGGLIGNVVDEELDLPTEPIVCMRDACRNGFDQQAKKVKPNEQTNED